MCAEAHSVSDANAPIFPAADAASCAEVPNVRSALCGKSRRLGIVRRVKALTTHSAAHTVSWRNICCNTVPINATHRRYLAEVTWNPSGNTRRA